MLKKPDSCIGCPMYQDGEGFVPDEIIEGAPVFVLGQNPGEDEEYEGRPFVGKTGQTMVNTYFPAAGLVRGENVSIGNVLRCRLNGTNDLPKGKTLWACIQHCSKEHLRIPETTKIIVAQGSLALKAVSPSTNLSITDLRGFLVPGGFNEGNSRQDTRRFEVEELQSKPIRVNKPKSKGATKSTKRISGSAKVKLRKTKRSAN